jgi:UMF1 family MFS transporter
MTRQQRSILAWCFFDWAHSAFPTLITTFIFSTYFIQSVASNKMVGTSQWGYALGLSGLFVALLSPFIGAVGDVCSSKKSWLAFFLALNVIATALLFFVQPQTSWVIYALICFAIANIAYELSQVFYNSLLVTISPKGMIGRISGWGWGLGYFGGLSCLSIALLVFVKSRVVSHDNALNIRSIMLLAACWFVVFAIPLFLWTQEPETKTKLHFKTFIIALKQLQQTLKSALKQRALFLFLIAHLLYIDGLNSLLAFGGIFAAGTFHMSYHAILVFAIALNISAGFGAVSFAYLDDRLGSKRIILFSLIALIILSGCLLCTHQLRWFWIFSLLLGWFVGPVQAASRSFMAHLAPQKQLSEMFGLYNLSGYLTASIGPLCIAWLTAHFHSQRVGLSSVVVLMSLGLIVLCYVRKPS